MSPNPYRAGEAPQECAACGVTDTMLVHVLHFHDTRVRKPLCPECAGQPAVSEVVGMLNNALRGSRRATLRGLGAGLLLGTGIGAALVYPLGRA